MPVELNVSLPKDLQKLVDAAIDHWQRADNTKRLWARDASLWTDGDEDKSLGWLDIVKKQRNDPAPLLDLKKEIREAGFTSAVLLGMGGSSLCPETLALLFGQQQHYPQLHVLDSTNPDQVKEVREKIDPEKTIFLVASKSGSTLETTLLKNYFLEEMKAALGPDLAGKHFIVVTDPGSRLERAAKDAKFRRAYYGDPSVGGRYAALSNFGLVAAAVAGLDIETLLTAAEEAVEAATENEVAKNPAVHLGIILATAASHHRDKLTFLLPPELRPLGAWLEQLIAESTGKKGKGIIPIDREHIAPASHYGSDRLFACVESASHTHPEFDRQIDILVKAGQPFVSVKIDDLHAVAGQFFFWEIATAVAGSLLGINPFDQPDVEAATNETRRLIETLEDTGRMPPGEPFFSQNGASGDENGIQLFAEKKYVQTLRSAAGEKPTLESWIKAHLDQIRPGDYFAVLAYLDRNEANEEPIQFSRHQVRGAKKAATSLGFGPRFLHSTGQIYKGGPDTGVFLQLTADHAVNLPVPGAQYSFGQVQDAQAAGDMAVLEQRGRRILRVHLGEDIKGGLKRLSDAIEVALTES